MRGRQETDPVQHEPLSRTDRISTGKQYLTVRAVLCFFFRRLIIARKFPVVNTFLKKFQLFSFAQTLVLDKSVFLRYNILPAAYYAEFSRKEPKKCDFPQKEKNIPSVFIPTTADAVRSNVSVPARDFCSSCRSFRFPVQNSEDTGQIRDL